MEVGSHEDSASELCCLGSIFSMKLLGFASEAIKLLLTESVGQCRNTSIFVDNQKFVLSIRITKVTITIIVDMYKRQK